MKKIGIVLVMMLSLFGCHGYTVHPGAPSTQSSLAYDVLYVAATTIDQGRIDIEKGALPQSAKGPLNVLISTYTVAKAALRTYDDALGTNSVAASTALQTLSADIAAVETAIKNFKGVK